MGVCSEGACVLRRCGDGVRERARAAFREGCDDANDRVGDACSPACAPTRFTVREDPDEERDAFPTERGRAVGVDGVGRPLFVWAERDGPGYHTVRARPYDRRAVALRAEVDAATVVAEGILIDPEPTVTGLGSGGWVMTFTGESGGDRDIRYTILTPDGTPGRLRTANDDREGLQTEARVAALSSGFVIVWTHRSPTVEDPEIGIRARVFTETGSPRTGDLLVATSLAGRQQSPAITADGDQWMVSWHDLRLVYGAPQRVFARRFSGTMALDREQIEIADGQAVQPSVAPLGDGDFVVAWASEGDVFARELPAGRGPREEIPVATTPELRESTPSIAPLGRGQWLVQWKRGSPARLDLAMSPGATRVPEVEELRMLLDDSDGTGSLAPSADGTWFVWSDGRGRATRRVSAYHLPID